MWFYLLVLDLLKDFFFIAVLKPTVNESFSVGIMLPPVPVFPNSYMLDTCSNKQEKKTVWIETTASARTKIEHEKMIGKRVFCHVLCVLWS